MPCLSHPSAFPSISYIHSSSAPFVLHALPISSIGFPTNILYPRLFNIFVTSLFFTVRNC
jgi:hypothetical protein